MPILRDGDVISLYDDKAGALSMSVPLGNYQPGPEPVALYRAQPAVRQVVDFIAENVASIPLKLYRHIDEDDRQRVRDHPVAVALKHPAPRKTAYRFLQALVLDRLLYDRWCVLKSTQPDGSLRLQRIEAWRVSFVVDSYEQVTDVAVLPDKGPLKLLDPAEVIWDVGYSADQRGSGSIVQGFSVPRTLVDVVDELDSGSQYRRQVMRNGARVPSVIERPIEAPNWSKEAKQRFADQFRANWTGTGPNAGGTPILEDGMAIKTANAFTPADTQWLEGKQLAAIEVANAFHIPPEILGLRQGTYSNVAAYRQQLYRDVLGSDIAALEQAFNAGLSENIDADMYVEADMQVKLRGGFEEQAQMLQTAVGRPYMTANEGRARLNLSALDGGDELVTPLNVVVGGQASPRDSAPPKAVTPQLKSAEEDVPDAKAERDQLAKELARFFERQSASVLPKLGASKALPPLLQVWDSQRWDRELSGLLQGRMKRLAVAGAVVVLSRWNPDHDGWAADVMDAWLAKAAAIRASTINNGTYHALADAITSGSEWKDAAKNVFDVAASRSDAHAGAVAADASSFGSHDAAKASGLGRKTWAVTSSRPRASHAAMDGETVGIDEVFSNGLRWPGDSDGGPDETAGCTCRLDYGSGK